MSKEEMRKFENVNSGVFLATVNRWWMPKDDKARKVTSAVQVEVKK